MSGMRNPYREQDDRSNIAPNYPQPDDVIIEYKGDKPPVLMGSCWPLPVGSRILRIKRTAPR